MGAGTRAVATPAPRRHLYATLAQDHTLRLRANTRSRHTRTPPPPYAGSRSHASSAREHRGSPRPHPAVTLHSLILSRASVVVTRPEAGDPGRRGARRRADSSRTRRG